MYQAKVPADDVDAALGLAAAGMRVVNVGVTLTRDPRGVEPAETVTVREADPERHADLPDLAARAFRLSRFHLDPAIPDEAAARVKRDWTANCLNGRRGDRVLVAERSGHALGFVAEIESGGVPVIDLVAVDSAAQARGVGRALVERFCADAAGRGATLVRVGTQAANPAAIRFYERLGWSFERADYDMHMHV